ncbi:hypothetical protein [Sphingomonas sp. M1-B02]|uniref:hypothetical protein n=1 Tax=Sphingomonas sp. M1-B02 TaxID=3114300 RepID=UPI00223E958E|nr:hypothetical protein [Sphingomonas sp. S6-11]UZK67569.1 hypothetical protein OKW87_06995 [Sphingomonas sp. S6-11]
MRAILAILFAISCLVGAAQAAAQGGTQAPGNWQPEPTPSIPAYTGSGASIGRQCATALQTASATPFQTALTKERIAGTTIDPKVALLGATFRISAKPYPFLEQAIVDRGPILTARLTCRSDPQAARIAPAELRRVIGLFAKETPQRVSICVPMRNAAIAILQRETVALNAKAGKTFTPFEVNHYLRQAAGVQEMLDDLKALCPASDIAAMQTRAGQIRSTMEKLLPAVLTHVDFNGPLLAVVKNATLASEAAMRPGPPDTVGCGILTVTYDTLRRASGYALAAYLQSPQTPPRHKAALKLADACWQSPEAVRAVAKDFPAR